MGPVTNRVLQMMQSFKFCSLIFLHTMAYQDETLPKRILLMGTVEQKTNSMKFLPSLLRFITLLKLDQHGHTQRVQCLVLS